jgi:hypothetical protein
MSLYTHWACFDCRKSFHHLPAEKARSRAQRKCSECGEAMRDMGVYFEPPPRRAKRAWAVMELLSRSGYRFQTEGSKAFIDTFILTTKRPTLEGVRRGIELRKQRDEESRIKLRVDRDKEERRRRRKRAAV